MRNSDNARRRGRGLLLSSAVAAASLVVAAPVFAANYYVAIQDSRASDSNPGTESLPWKSLAKINTANLQPGDTVYVKSGSYQISGGTWARPAINPMNSGTKDRPITIKSIPRHGAKVKATGEGPAFGSRMRHYIVIDGFVITSVNPKGVAVFGEGSSSKVNGVTIQNNIVENISNSLRGDNTDGIRVEHANGAIVRNNVIRNIYNGMSHPNAAGVKLYNAKNTLVENNEVYSAAGGIYDKVGGQYNVIRRNYVHDCTAGEGSGGLWVNSNTSEPAAYNQIYQNVVNKCAVGFGVMNSVDKTLKVYNNVFANYVYAIRGPLKTLDGRHNFYNNIFYAAKDGVTAVYNYDDPLVTIALSDYNLFVGQPRFLIGQYSTNHWFNSLSAWQSGVARDKHSLVGDAAFVSLANGDFRLNNWSIAKNAGRVGGIATGTPVDMGAYPSGNEIIGVLSNTDKPVAPVLVDVR